MTEQLNLNQTIKLTVLTPLHIGAGTEKRMAVGIDYFYMPDEKKVYIIDTNKLFAALRQKGADLSIYSQMIAQKQTENLRNYLFDRLKIPIASISSKAYPINNTPENEINTFIRSGLNQPYIPGSSLKGAIRTAVFHHLYEIHEKDYRGNLIITKRDEQQTIFADKAEQHLIGSFDNSIMRHIKVGDAACEDNQLQLLFVNLFDLSLEEESYWRDDICVTAETLKAKENTNFRLSIAQPFIEILKTKFRATLPTYIDKVIPKQEPLTHLFRIINQYTIQHLEREIEFLKPTTKLRIAILFWKNCTIC
ncbi:MAG: type III-A CRISPR-associated RAMP protein Csm5 [Sphingobacteriales bacterium]|nr:type III-A CRISPR-associated RAMP protein Csm5 [Sphingobacteriales bacterium]